MNIAKIVKRSAKILGVEIDEGGVREIARAAAPRRAPQTIF
jgi:Holliday junction resolvasome RuvABC ATP-dependent DNA helicase subunit